MLKKIKKQHATKRSSKRIKKAFANHKMLATWLITALLVTISSTQIFLLNTPEAHAATVSIDYGTESQYTQEEMKGTATYYTQVTAAKGNLKVSSGGANVDISASSNRIKRGCRAIITGTSYKIIDINDASQGLITLPSSVSSGPIDHIYCTTFGGSTAALGTGTILTSSTTSLSNTSGVTHHIAYDSTNKLVFAAAVASNLIKKFTVATETFASDITVTTGTYDVAYDATNNKLWATDSGSYNIYKITPTTGDIDATYSTGFGAYHAVYAATPNKLYFSAVDKLKSVAVGSGTVDETGTAVGTTPKGVAYDSGTGSIWVVNNGSNNVTKVKTSDGTVTGTYSVGTGPTNIAYDATNSAVWIPNDTANTVTKLAASDGSTTGTYTIGSGGNHSVAFNPSSNTVWISNPGANTITILNAADGSLSSTYSLTGADDMAYDSDTQSMWVYDSTGNNLVRLGGDAPYISGNGYSFTTASGSSINATGWSALNSATVTETKNGQSIFYGVSFNGGHTYGMWTGSAWRSVASDLNSVHGGTEGNWYYRDGGNTWAATTNTNTASGAFSQSQVCSGCSANSMTGTTLNAMTSGNWSTSGGWTSSVTAIDIAAFFSTTNSFVSPSIDSLTFDYASVPTVNWSASTGSGSEATTPATVSAQIGSTYASDVTAWYTITGTATSGDDFTPLSGTVTIPTSSTTTAVTIPITNDAIKEPSETVILTLYSAINGTIGSTSVFTYTITDDDTAPTVAFTASSSSTSEGVTAASIPVSLSAASGQDVSVNYAVTSGTATGSGSDYTLASGTLTIPAGMTSKNITFTVVDDAIVESDETIIVTLSSPTNATLGASNIVHTYTIKDNDGSPIVYFTSPVSQVTEGSTASIPIQLSKNPATGQDVVVNYEISGGTAASGINYTYATPGSVTLTSTTPVNLTPVTITDSDSIDQTLILRITSITNANAGVNTQNTLTIREASVTTSTPANIRANGGLSPASVTGTDPVLSWRHTAGVTSDSQTAYQVVFASSTANLSAGTYTCDSGKVTSERSVVNAAAICTGGLSAGTQYWKVRTYNANDSASSYSDAQTLTITAISAPTACAASSITSSSLTLGWTDNSSNETAFEVEASYGTNGGSGTVSDGNYARITTTAANAVSYDVSGLSPNRVTYYRVRAITNSGGSSYVTCGSSGSRTLATTPGTPTLTPLSTSSINVVLDPNGNSSETTYAINVNSTLYVQANTTLASTPIYATRDTWGARGVAITGLSTNTAYVVNVIARNGDSVSTSASSSATIYTLASAVVLSTSSPAANSFSVSVAANGNPSATLVAISVDVYGGTQTRYVGSDGLLTTTATYQTPATWATRSITTLVTTSNYRLQGIAKNGDGVLTYSLPVAENTTSGAPTGYQVTALGPTSASFSVDTQTGYQYSFNSGSLSSTATYTNSSLTNDNATANQTVKLNNGADTATVTMPICSAVATPGTPTFDSASTKLTINTSTNPSTISYAIQEITTNQYVTTNGTLSSSQTWATYASFGGASGITITGLTSGADYEFRVYARNCNNIQTAASTSVVAEIPVQAPIAPTVAITSDGTGASSARITLSTSGYSTANLSHYTFAIYDVTTNQYVQLTAGSSTGNGVLGSTASWNTAENWGTGGSIVTGLPGSVTHEFAIKARKTISGTPTDSGFSYKTQTYTAVNKPLIAVYSTSSSTIAFQINPENNASTTTSYSFELVPSSGTSTYLQSGGTNNTFASTASWTLLSTWDSADGTTDGLITISDLSPNTAYTLRLQARNSDSVVGYVSPITTMYTDATSPSSPSANGTNDHVTITWAINGNTSTTSYLITESTSGKYVSGNTLVSAASWATFDSATSATHSTYVTDLTAGQQYCFTIKARNGDWVETSASDAACVTPTAPASSGGSSSSTSTSTSSTSETATTTTIPPSTSTTQTPPPTTTETTTPTAPPPNTPTTPETAPTIITPPAPVGPSGVTPEQSGTTSATTPTSTTPSVTGGSASSSGGTAYVSPEEFTKQMVELKKQKDEGLITFQIGNLQKEVRTKAETGITREVFITSLVNDLNLKKVYSASLVGNQDINKIAEKLNILSVFTDSSGVYDKTKFLTNNEAYRTMLIAINVTDAEACKQKIFDFCVPPNPEQKLSKDISDSLFRSSKNFLALQSQARSQKIDTDHDGVTDWDEINIYGTDPLKADTDSDGLKDGEETLKYKTDPLVADSDNDGLKDGDEIHKYKTNPLKADTDTDGFSDKVEIDKKTNPLDPLDFPHDIKVQKGTSDSDHDGLCDRCETDIGTDPQNPDTDHDGITDGLDAEPLVFNAKNEPVKLLITNIRSGLKTPTSPLVRGSATANSQISIIAKNEYGLKREIGNVQASENNLFAADLKPLPNGTFYLEAQDEKGNISPQVKVIIDSALKVDSPRVDTIDGKPLNTDSEPEVSSSPLIKAHLLSGKAIFTFRSAIGTATLISDTPAGSLEIRPPENLALGEHEVIAYTVKDDDNVVSPPVKYRFKVTEASTYNASDFFIKNNAASGLVSFVREKTVWPIFQKIFIGVGIVLVLWLLISVIQFFRRKKE